MFTLATFGLEKMIVGVGGGGGGEGKGVDDLLLHITLSTVGQIYE